MFKIKRKKINKKEGKTKKIVKYIIRQKKEEVVIIVQKQ